MIIIFILKTNSKNKYFQREILLKDIKNNLLFKKEKLNLTDLFYSEADNLNAFQFEQSSFKIRRIAKFLQ